jgi:hypothetical protein
MGCQIFGDSKSPRPRARYLNYIIVSVVASARKGVADNVQRRFTALASLFGYEDHSKRNHDMFDRALCGGLPCVVCESHA